jgi:hypothetical protein
MAMPVQVSLCTLGIFAPLDARFVIDFLLQNGDTPVGVRRPVVPVLTVERPMRTPFR